MASFLDQSFSVLSLKEQTPPPAPFSLPPSRTSRSSAQASTHQLDQIPPALPNELFVRILEHGAKWTPTELTLICRVSKTFLAIARPLLYRSIHFDTAVGFCPDEGECFHDCDMDCGYRGRDCEHECYADSACGGVGCLDVINGAWLLLRCLQDHSHLVVLVKEVRWGCEYDNSDAWERFDATGSDEEALDLYGEDVIRMMANVADLLDLCPHLVTLTITTDNWKWSSELIRVLRYSKAIRRISTFKWLGVDLWEDVDPVDGLFDFFCLMKKLKNLQLGSVDEDYNYTWPAHIQPPFGLRSFVMPSRAGGFPMQFVTGLLQTSHNSLRHLHIPLYDTLPFSDKLSSLLSLRLTIPCTNIPSLQPILSKCPLLRGLDIAPEDPTSSVNLVQDYKLALADLPPYLLLLTFNRVTLTPASLRDILKLPQLREIKHRGLGRTSGSKKLPSSWSFEDREEFISVTKEKGITCR